jgi:hypothetical protein
MTCVLKPSLDSLVSQSPLEDQTLSPILLADVFHLLGLVPDCPLCWRKLTRQPWVSLAFHTLKFVRVTVGTGLHIHALKFNLGSLLLNTMSILLACLAELTS